MHLAHNQEVQGFKAQLGRNSLSLSQVHNNQQENNFKCKSKSFVIMFPAKAGQQSYLPV